MRAWQGQQELQDRYVARMRAHVAADEVIQGDGWNGEKGCSVGCTFDRYDHSRGPVEIGFPEWLIHLQDAIHEGLPHEASKTWTVDYLLAARPGADLEWVRARFFVWLLIDPKHGVRRFSGGDSAVESVIDRVAALWQRVIDGESEESLQTEFSAAWAAAWAARDVAPAPAWAAAWAAGDVARAAAWAAAWAARDVAPAPAWAAAWAAGDVARAAHWIAIRDELIRLMAAAPIVDEVPA